MLASVVLVGLAPAQRRGRDARRLTDLKESQTALELYYNKCGHYPGGSDCAGAGIAADWTALIAALTGSSIGVSQMPDDPSAGKHYGYYANNERTQYLLTAVLEDANNPVLQRQPPASEVNQMSGFSGTCGSANLYCVLF
jgi:hypothetical protein